MKLIVGLGNPGKEYEATRHNIGYKAIDAVAHHLNVKLKKKKFSGIYYKDENYVLAKPETYMNLSGDFVQKIIKYFKIDTKDILVIYDDMDLGTAVLRYREKGSSGGQKGMQDIIDKLGTQEIKRLKIGIGRPRNGGKNWVLGKFSTLQVEELNKAKKDIVSKILDFIEGA